MFRIFKWQGLIGLFIILLINITSSAQINFPFGSNFKYLKGIDAVGISSDWVNTDFDDSAWQSGSAPFRYGDGEGGTELTDMQGNYSTMFLRSIFTANNIDSIGNIMVTADWDDGFVMFVNGKEVLRRQAPDVISYDALSDGLHEFGEAESFDLSINDLGLLEGENTLAVFGCNTSLGGSSDFYFDVNIFSRVVIPDLPEFADTIGVSFNKQSGFYYANFSVTITSPIADANIVYTLDGSNPQTSFTSEKAGSTVVVDINPDSETNRGITPGVVLRASTVKDGFKPAKPNARTFIFLDKVKKQSYPGHDWPNYNVNGQWIDYDMDQEVTISGTYANKIEDALLDIPTVSIITDNANLFDPREGIYVNAMQHGANWERECSVELINPDGSEGFNVNAGLRIRGGYSRHSDYPKHAFRLFFRSEYGPGKLRYPLFEDEGVDRFDKIDLRCAQNYGWNNWGGENNTFIREVFLRDAQGETGSAYTRSRYYHLYLNGMYWGLFQTQERAEARFASDYLGGKNEDWDIVKRNQAVGSTLFATDGNMDKWREVWDITEDGYSNNENYFKLEGKDKNGKPIKNSEILVDVDNLIDYMINIFYSGNFDSPTGIWSYNNEPNNLYMIKDRTNKTQGFKFMIHDAEHTMMMYSGIGHSATIGINENRVDLGYRADEFRMNKPGFNRFHTQWLHHRLVSNKEYCVRFADRAMKRLSGKGIFTEEANIKRLDNRADMIDMAIIAESARWGDMKHNPAYTKADWEDELNVLRNSYFPRRSKIVIDQLWEYELYPSIDAPIATIDGNEIFEESVAISSNSSLAFSSSQGEIYYTVDGSDPRAIGGDLSISALKIESGKTISISESAVIKARVVKGDDWSGIREIDFIADQHDFSKFKVTELHYHPTDSIVGTDTIDGKEYEFIEFKNTGTRNAINLSGVVIDSAINFEFPENTLLPPQQYYVVAAKPKKFYDRYGLLAMGNSSNSFSNGGERVLVIDKLGDIVMDFTYSDKEPWPTSPDGDGPSLVSAEGNPTGDPNDYYYWLASGTMNGSPNHNDVISGVEENVTTKSISDAFLLYPNPTNKEFKLIYKGNNNNEFELKLYDLKGSLLFAESYFSKASVSLVELGIDYGVYMLSIESNKQIETRKVVYAPY